MTKEPWNKHTPGDPMPCKCGESRVEVRFRNDSTATDIAKYLSWGKLPDFRYAEIIEWRFTERKGEDAIAADPYPTLEWDEDDTAIVKLKKPGQPWWVRDDDLVRFSKTGAWLPVSGREAWPWDAYLAFQIKRRPVLTPAEPQLLLLLSAATYDEADFIRFAARRANIEVPE